MKLLGNYINGNYKVAIFDEGTKIRQTINDKDTIFIADHPESMDIKITNKCNIGCKFCHENSTINGEHGDIMNEKFIETLLPYTELAIGGGNPLEHPDLIPFLEKCKKLNLIPSMTINQKHFLENKELVNKLIKEKLIYGLGISLTNPTDEFIKEISKYPNAVIHVINGVHSLETLKKLYGKHLKLLILGYKNFRRGVSYYENNEEQIEHTKTDIYNNIKEIINNFKVVSFDNLALKQLDLKRIMTQDEWDEFYMGDDGQYTMYIDMVKQEFAKSSTSTTRHKLLDNIKEMFDIVKKENNLI